MPRLIAVSHRVPIEPAGGSEPADRSALAVALAPALRESNGFWFGWSGAETDSFTGQIAFRRIDGVATAAIDLEPSDAQELCSGFAARTLWPLFHERLDLAETFRAMDAGFARISWRFAQTLSPLIEADDLVWVHDYHLIPLGRTLREQGFGNRIGFFLHIPWPPARLLASLPEHRALVLALLSYDVIGFQTAQWRAAFLEYATGALGATLEGEHLTFGALRARVLVCPIGLDAADFGGAVHSLIARQAETRLAVSALGRDLILGVDRLDPAKGLAERLLGYERLLGDRPELRDKVFLLQIAPPAREDAPGYREVRDTLAALTGRINGTFGAIDWVPIRYVNQSYARDELFGIYRAAAVGLVTPTRDGMNLVAKEFVAAQDPADPGVLVLSRFAGAAAQMGEAVIVNPHSPEDIASGLARGLAMPLAERQERHKALLAGIIREDARWWSQRFLDALGGEPAQKAGLRLVAAVAEPLPEA